MEARTKVHATMTPAAEEYYDKIESEIRQNIGKSASRISSDFT